MEQLGVELPAVTFSWFLSLFTACLPIQTVFRVWDMLFLEGNVILFRVAFAILSLKSKALLDTPTAASFYQQLHMATAYWYDADELVSTCLSMREKIRASDISARRAKLLKRLRDSFSQSVSTPVSYTHLRAHETNVSIAYAVSKRFNFGTPGPCPPKNRLVGMVR